MLGDNVRDDLAQVCRILAYYNLIDLWGHVSLRVPKSDVMLITPRFARACLPRNITGSDLLLCDLAGRLLEGHGDLPLQAEVDFAIYRRNQAQSACIFASPQTTLAAGIARFPLKPLTHRESMVAFGLAFWEANDLADSDVDAQQLAERVIGSTAVHQPGIGVWVAGKHIFESLMNVYHLEYLAQANLILADSKSDTRTVERAHSDKVWSQSLEPHHYHKFFASLDPGPQPHPYYAFLKHHSPGLEQFEELKAAIAFSCRALWERGTLVAFLEHISHRLPIENRFLITDAKNFRDMEPKDMILLDYKANWIAGPRPPNFKWFHAQIMAERKDVQAIVHTHELYGRVYPMGERELALVYRVGIDIATRHLPIYPRCDLILDAEVRRQVIEALGDGPVVHEAAHGTDFVSETLEKATVDAIQREAFISMHHLAERFGKPQSLPAKLVERVHQLDSNPLDWWWFYTAEVGAPRRSVGGL